MKRLITAATSNDELNKFYRNKNYPDRYWKKFGEFLGYDGYEYVALQKLGAFPDKTVLRKSNFNKLYEEVQLKTQE